MAGLLDLIKGLNGGIQQGIDTVVQAPKKITQAVSSPQGKQVLANLARISLEKKKKEEEDKARVQSLINSQMQTNNVQGQTISAPSSAPLDVAQSGLASLQTRFDPVQQLSKNIGDGYNAVREPIVNAATQGIMSLNPLNSLLARLKVNNPIESMTKGAVSGALTKTFEDPVKNFSDNILLARNKFQTGNKNFGDYANATVGTAADTAGLAMSAIPFVAQYNAGVGALQGNERTKPLGDAINTIGSLPTQGLEALVSKLPVSDEVKKALVMGGNLGLLKVGSKLGEKVQTRINDAGYKASLMDSLNQNLARDGSTFNSGPNFSPIIKALVNAEKSLVKNPVVQALDPTGLTQGASAKSSGDWLTQATPTKVIAYTGRANKVDDFGKTRADNLFFSKNPEVAEYYGGTKDNVTRSEINTEGFADLSNDINIYKYVSEKFTNSDIDKIYGEPKIPSRYTPEVQQKMTSEHYNNKRNLLQNEQFAGGKTQGVLLEKLKLDGYKGAILADKAMVSNGTAPDTSIIVFDKSRAKVAAGEPVFAGNVKMKNIGSSDDARALINLGAQRLKAEGGDGYKEVVSLDQVKQETKDLSERTGINKATLEQWAKESVENRVRITAAREAMSSYAEQVASLSMKIRNEPTNMALKQELADKVRSMQEIQAATSTIIAESGRTLGANRIKTLQGDALLIQKYIKDNQGKDPSGIADFLGSVSPKDLPDAIKKLTMPSWLDRIMTVRQAALLTDPRTTERNLLGNTLGVGLRAAQKPFDIIADKIISGFNKTESTRSFSELLPGNKYKKMLAKKEIDQYLEKYANESGKFDNTALKKTFIEKGADKVFQFLEFQDKIFKRMIAKDSIVSSARSQAAQEKLTGKAYKLRMEELVKNPTNDMLLNMANEATKWTYQNKPNSRVYDTVAGIRNKIPVVGKLAVPFLRTVWNLGSMAIERTVPGQALNLYKLTQGKISGKQALSSLLLTAAIQGVISTAVESGGVTGTERDPKKRAIREAEGIKDDVVNTPFGSFSYKNLEPVSSIIGTAVDVHKTAKNVFSGEKGVVSGAGSVGFSMADRFVNNSFLRGIKDLLDLAPGYQDFSGRNAEERSVNNLGDYGKQQLASLYPRAFNWLEEITNEAKTQRPEGFLENIMASTPGLSNVVATKVDIWGQDVKKQDVTGNSALNTVLAALVPIQIEKQRNDPVNKEILRLKYYPSVPTQTIEGVTLSNKEYETYAREAGTMAKARLDMLIKDPIYQRKSDADKISAIESTIEDSRKEAKKALGSLLDVGQRENLNGKNAKEVEDAAKKVFKEVISPTTKQKTAEQIKSGAKTAAKTAAKGAQKVQSINNMIDAISEQLTQRTEQEILNTIKSKTGSKFSEEEILFAIDMAKTGQKMSTTNPQDATQEYLQKNVIK